MPKRGLFFLIWLWHCVQQQFDCVNSDSTLWRGFFFSFSFSKQLDGAQLNGTEHRALEMFSKVLLKAYLVKNTIFNLYSVLKMWHSWWVMLPKMSIWCTCIWGNSKTAQYIKNSIDLSQCHDWHFSSTIPRCPEDLFRFQNTYKTTSSQSELM